MLHETCCRILEILITFDQVQVPNLAAAAITARQIQLCEERYRDKAGPKDYAMGCLPSLTCIWEEEVHEAICVSAQTSASGSVRN